MTTATPAATPTTLVGVRTADRDRLKDEVEAAKTRLEEQQTALKAAQTKLDKGTADVAAQEQETSRLRQQLAAATTGPERHRIELALDAAAVLRLRALREQVDGADGVASGQAAITLTSAAQSRLEAELTTAEAALTQAKADEDEVAASAKDLATTVAQVVADVVALDPRVAEADARLDALLGSPQMRIDLIARMDAVAAQDAQRRATVRAADDAVLAADADRSKIDGDLATAAAAHARALSAVRDAAGAPKRLADATAAVDAVRTMPDLDAGEQAAITAAATGADDPTVIPVLPPAAPVTRLENWAIKIPAAVLTAATAFVAARAVLTELRALKGDELLTTLTAAQTTLVAALTAQLAAAQTQVTAAEAAQAAVDEVTAHEATAADRRALAVSGN
jgi:hypothetical protein